jgi:CheY-like chemotaxis protein
MFVVIVEDDLRDREFAHGALRKNVIDVLSFQESLSALQYLRSARADVVLIDYHLPGSPNGLTLARHLRTLYPAITLVMMSAYATEPELVEAIQIGVDDFIRKPIVAESEGRVVLQGCVSPRVAHVRRRAPPDPSKWLAQRKARGAYFATQASLSDPQVALPPRLRLARCVPPAEVEIQQRFHGAEWLRHWR